MALQMSKNNEIDISCDVICMFCVLLVSLLFGVYYLNIIFGCDAGGFEFRLKDK